MDSIADSTDYLIVDTGAGINTNVLYFCMAARQRLLVVTPEPTSLTDAYALIKVLHIKHGIDTFRVCINMAPDVKTAKQIFGRLCDACDQFLTGVSLDLSGIIPFDAEVRRAVMNQKPFLRFSPSCAASAALRSMAAAVPQWGGPRGTTAISNFSGKIPFPLTPNLIQQTATKVTVMSISALARLFRSNTPWDTFESGARTWEDFSAPDQEAIVSHYSQKIRFLAQRLKKRLPPSIELNELISSGTLGLMEALGKFRPDLGIKFDTYAENRIYGSMLDELRHQDCFTRTQRQHVRSLNMAAEAIEHDTGRRATEEELSKATGLSLSQVRQGLEAIQGQQQLPIDLFQDNYSTDEHASGGVPCDEAMHNELIDKLTPLLAKLTDREREVLALYYTEELTMSEIASILHITEGRVSQLRAKALARLRKAFVETYGSM